jgi:hypothetical protein
VFKFRQFRFFDGKILTHRDNTETFQSNNAESRLPLRQFFAALIPMFRGLALVKLLLGLGELIMGVFVGTTVLALGIFMIVSAACIGFM